MSDPDYSSIGLRYLNSELPASHRVIDPIAAIDLR